MMETVYICSAARTPVGSFNGGLSSLRASDLGGLVIKEVLQRSGVSACDVDDVLMGQALQAGQGQNPARQSSISAGVSVGVPATTVNMLCGSGLKTVALASQAIRCGDVRVVVAGGQECMSKAPHVVGMREGVKFGDVSLVDSMLSDGLTDAFNLCHMGMTAETVASRWQVTRQEQDEFAVKSQNKTELAQTQGWFKDEIIPVTIQTRKGPQQVEKDEFPRSGCSLEAVAKLKPAFIKDSSGTVTAGNASGINDGAAAVLLASGSYVKHHDLLPMARVVSWAQAGVEPMVMGTGPVPAVRAALDKAGWSLSDVDLIELNEAFAAQSLAVIKELGLEVAKVNVSGGAIALGHPIGASGTRILVTLLYNMKRLGVNKGVAALCVGGGMGVAICVERCGEV